jgi:hypothetical protein
MFSTLLVWKLISSTSMFLNDVIKDIERSLFVYWVTDKT